MKRSIALSDKDVERFWSKVDKNGSNGCWIWKAGDNGDGYGKFYIHVESGYPQRYAHHVSWVLAYGDIPDGLWVLHKCDTPACIRPEHLFLGTQTDNMQDAAQKGRVKGGKRGEGAGSNKLKEYEVLEIREMMKNGVPQNEIARRYSVSPTTILYIKCGRLWSWLK